MTPDHALSRRTSWSRVPCRWVAALTLAKQNGLVRLDLACGNPTQVGLRHAPAVYASLGDEQDAHYQPYPLGLPQARQAVAAYYGDSIDPQHVWICASTSEAYAMLWTLLCDPGDAVALPQPGYPLLDMLCGVGGVETVGYPMRYDGRWHLDVAGLAETVLAQPRLRAIVSVSPNNPTGNRLSAAERAAIEAHCGPHGVAHVIDEVFADYALDDPAPGRAERIQTSAGLSFTLSGLSKVAALPQLKLSWIVVGGSDAARIAEVGERAAVLADAFLTVGTPVQRALPGLLSAAEPMQRRVSARAQAGLQLLRDGAVGQPWDVLHAEAGWTALLRLPQGCDLDDEGWALTLLRAAGVVTTPGFLFDTAAEGPPLLAVSLLTEPETLAAGAAAIRRVVADNAASHR